MASAFQPLIYPTSYRERRNIASSRRPIRQATRSRFLTFSELRKASRNSMQGTQLLLRHRWLPRRAVPGRRLGQSSVVGRVLQSWQRSLPTWHRAYLWRLENALRSIKGCEHVALSYWDETDQDTAENGLPAVFTSQTFVLDTGEAIKNPLYSYKFQEPVWDNLSFPPIISDGDNFEY